MIAGLDRRYGGPTQSVPRLCQAMREIGFDAQLLSVRTGADADATVRDREDGVSLFPWDFESVPLARSLRASSSLARALMKQADRGAIIHNHGLWLMPNVYAGRSASECRVPLVVTPRGMLDPYALRISRIRKALFWHALQKRAFARVSCFHATSEAEYRDIRAFNRQAPIAIVPNGVDLPLLPGGPRLRQRLVVSLGRLHLKKNLPGLLAAWREVEKCTQDWRLQLVGPDEDGHAGLLRDIVERLGLQRVTIEPPKYGRERDELLSRASLLVMPSHSENFGMAVAEALAAGVPVIASRNTPWADLETQGCGWWVRNDPQSLAAALKAATQLTVPELQAMGDRGRHWMERDFAWASVARQLIDVYRWVSGVGDMPGSVRLD